MTKDELKDALKKMGWKQTHCAEKMKVSTTTINAWCTGKAPIPPWAEEFILLRMGINDLARR